jgi:transcriptional regulator with XRE-family HTH domain
MDEKIISRNIQKLRKRKNLTLQDLADRTGLTKGYLSRVERSQKAPPYSTLIKISGALGIEVTTILKENFEPQADVRFCLARAAEDRIIRETDLFAGYDYVVLGAEKPGKNMEPFIIYAPFDIHRMYTHEGEEFIYVMEGRLDFHYGEEVHTLETGDHVYFDSYVPHSGKSLGKKKAKLMVVIYFYKRNRQ